jgi:peptidoglycan/LPS O-acetylase OafA/YrhL
MGKVGVWLFFVLSAFLLSHKFIVRGFDASGLLGYAIGRIIRIIPLFIITVLLYSIAGYYPATEIMNIVTFKHTYAHLWTIPVEFKFYLLLPLVTFFSIYINRKFSLTTLVLTSIIFISVQQYFFPFYRLPENCISMLWYIPSFLIGIIAAVLYSNKLPKITSVKSDLIVTSILAIIVLASPGARYFIFGMEMTKDLMKQFIPISFAWAVFLLLLVDGNGIYGSLMTSKVFRKLGNWSFSIYLFHWVVYAKMAGLFLNNYYAMFFSFFCAIIIGAIFHALIEVNIEKSRHKLMDAICGLGSSGTENRVKWTI